jgi:ElaB/YqjD/DUF883 family membrane-anchored ribosome-binding protein
MAQADTTMGMGSLKSTVAHASNSASSAASLVKEVKDEARGVIDQILDTPYGKSIEQAAVTGYAKSRTLLNQIDAGVKQNPWIVVAGVSVVTLAAGFFLAKMFAAAAAPVVTNKRA